MDEADNGQERKGLRDTVLNRKSWHERHAATNRRFSLFSDGATMIATAAVPLLLSFELKSAATAVSSLAIILQGLSRLGRLREMWIRHRSTANVLQRLLDAYDFRIAEFEGLDTAKATARLGREYLAVVRAEQNVWSQSLNDAEKAPNNGSPDHAIRK